MSAIKEIIISLLVCLFVLIILSLGFYRFIPNNKVIPDTITYQASEELKNELNSEVNNNSDNIIKTYEITANDLDKYQSSKEYVPGKKNPFAPVQTETDSSNSENNVNTDDNSSGTSNSNGTNSGSLFDKPGTK